MVGFEPTTRKKPWSVDDTNLLRYLIKNISRTSAVSTHLIFEVNTHLHIKKNIFRGQYSSLQAALLVLVIHYIMGEFLLGGVLFFVNYNTIIVSVGICTLGGEFELDQTSHLSYKFITVVSTIILLYHMYGRRYILFCLPPALISGRVRIQNIISYLI